MSGRGTGAAVILALLALSGVVFFLGLGRLALIEKDEPRYAGTAREMVRSGDWLVPRFNDRERLVKPPLTYWAMAASCTVTGGADEGSARLPSAVAGTLVVLLVAAGASRAWGWRWGGGAGAMLATSLLFLVEARLATTDMLFTLFFTAAAACWLPVLGGSPRSGRWILLSGLAAGLAGLTKTPVAILLPPAAAVLAAGWLHRSRGGDALPAPFRRGNRGRTALALLGALGLFAAVFLPWGFAAEGATEGRLSAALAEQLEARVSTARDVHVKPFWYYLVWVVPAALPWALLLPAGAAAAAREARRPGSGGVMVVYAASLAAVVLVFFSLFPSKLVSYILPAMPPLALLAAAGLRAAVEEPDGRAAHRARWIGGAAAFLLAVAVAVAFSVPALAERLGPAAMRAAAPAVAVFGGLLGVGGILLLARRPLAAGAALGLVGLSGVFTLPPVYPHFEAVRSARGLAAAMLEAGLRPGDRLFDVTNPLTGLPFYADHPTERAPGSADDGASVKDLLAAAAEGGRVWAVLDHDPADDNADWGGRTQWERVLEGWPRGALPPRVVFRGMGRVGVTTARE